MKENLEFLFSQSNTIPIDQFVVARVKPFTDTKEPIQSEQIEQIYWGTNDRASLLFGFGIARQVAQESGNVLLIFNQNQGVTFPENMNYE